MYVLENPVLQRELLVNLRTVRAFVLLFAYNALLGAVVVLAWPQDLQLDLTRNPEEAIQLVDLFFIGQYVIASLMAPSFAAGAITGEKERKTYEMLLASPLRPAAKLDIFVLVPKQVFVPRELFPECSAHRRRATRHIHIG